MLKLKVPAIVFLSGHHC